LEEEKEVISVPIEAVYENDNGEEYVNKIKDDGTVEETVIETGIADDSYVQVISGLELNDKVQIITETTESSTTSTDSGSDLSGFTKGMNGGDDKGLGGDMQGENDNMKGERPDSAGGNGGEMPSGGGMPSGNK
jgi:HlyD family secretion protein